MDLIYVYSNDGFRGIYNFYKQKIGELYDQEWEIIKNEMNQDYRKKFQVQTNVNLDLNNKLNGNKEMKLMTYNFAVYQNKKLMFFTSINNYPSSIEVWNLFSNAQQKDVTKKLFKMILSFFEKDAYLIVKKSNPYFLRACKLYVNCGFLPVKFENQILSMVKKNKELIKKSLQFY